jgi:hypothetical protein
MISDRTTTTGTDRQWSSDYSPTIIPNSEIDPHDRPYADYELLVILV